MLFSQNSALSCAPMGEELVMMDVEQGQYFGLNPIACAIWQLLETPRNIDDLVAALMQQFEVSEAQCRQDTEVFIKELMDKEFIKAELSAQ
ncbi:PqqD family protein [Shewanella sp. 10N.286.45.A1]|uniref:PqqD family protein n=1 Tax=Shewanella sp. 10N.286.45.A1 TaxID=3229694 RepID=UPI00354FD6F4